MAFRRVTLAFALSILAGASCDSGKTASPRPGTGGATSDGTGGTTTAGSGGTTTTGSGGTTTTGTGGAGGLPAGSAGGAVGGNGGDGGSSCGTTGAAGAAAMGCDLEVARKAVAALGLTAVCPLTSSNATLPATLTDANWGLKADVCRQGGYDITPLAGMTVCLATQAITDLCQGMAANVFVAMHNGTVDCIYKVLRPGSRFAPGVYSTVDPLCHP